LDSVDHFYHIEGLKEDMRQMLGMRENIKISEITFKNAGGKNADCERPQPKELN